MFLKLNNAGYKNERLTEKAFVLDQGLVPSGKAPDGVSS